MLFAVTAYGRNVRTDRAVTIGPAGALSVDWTLDYGGVASHLSTH
jgi:hypothetical protein